MHAIESRLAPLIASIPQDADRAVRLVDLLLTEALCIGVSDIHLECRRDALLVKMRLDGRLHLAAQLGSTVRDAVLSRLKVMAKLVIYKSRLPQDGRLDYSWGGETVACRVAFLPSLHGEKVVIRLPDRRQAEMELADLGMREKMLGQVESLLQKNQGAILLTGPSSSGKTTTIYAMLKALSRLRGDSSNIVTLEDPIEADLGMVTQTQVETEQGMTFEQGLRTLLRQDPDVIMIGEIRDFPTAQIAIQAGLTGHLVISTLHCGRASSVFTRLVQMGIEPYMVAASIRAALAQRLVRKLCPACKVKNLERETMSGRGVPSSPGHCWKPVGCPECGGIGYRGRIGLFELIEMDEALRRMILSHVSESEIRAYLAESGVAGLEQDAADKAGQGWTSLEEALGNIE